MAFRGEASQISLTSIFQTLSLEGQKGILEVKLKGKTLRLFFRGARVRLIAAEPGSAEPLGYVLVKERVLSQAQFANVLQTITTRSYIGQELIERGILSAEFVLDKVKFHFEELILEFITIKNAQFHFDPRVPDEEDELFPPDTLGSKLDFDVTSLLMEAARREDEWKRLRELIPTDSEVPVPVSTRKFNEALNQMDIPQDLREDLGDLITGELTIGRISSQSRFPAFHVFQAVSELINKEALRLLDPGEKKELAERLKDRFQLQEARSIVEGIIQANPEDTEATLILASVQEQLGEKEELVKTYLTLSAHAQKSHNSEEAKRYLEKVILLDPSNLKARLNLLEICHERDIPEESFQVARELVQAARSHTDPNEARALVERCIELFPEELSFRHALAAICSKAGDQKAALENLFYLANQYRKLGAVRNLRRIYEQIVKIDPSASGRLAQVMQLEGQEIKRKHQRLRRILLRSAVFLFSLGFSVCILLEIGAYRNLAEAKEKIGKLIATSKFEEAKKLIDRFGSKYPFSTVQIFLQKIKLSVSQAQAAAVEIEAQSRREKRLLYQSRVTSAKIALRAGRWEEARALLNSIDPTFLEEDEASEVIVLRNKVESYLLASQKLYKEAQKALAEDRPLKAFKACLRLYTDFPDSPHTRDLSFPLYVETIPSKAQVFLGGVMQGHSPCLIAWNPDQPSFLSIRKQGYRSCKIFLENPEEIGWALRIHLEKSPLWQNASLSTADPKAALAGGVLVIADRAGRLSGLLPQTGQVVWVKRLEDIGGVKVSPVCWENKILFLTMGGSLYDFSRTDWSFTRSDFSFLAPVRIEPSSPTKQGIVAFAAPDGTVCGYSIPLGKLLWRINLNAPVRIGPVRFGDHFTVFDNEGRMWEVKSTTGKAVRKLRLKSGLEVRPLPVEGIGVLVACGRKLLMLQDGKIKKERLLPASASGDLLATSDLVLVCTQNGFAVAYKLPELRFSWKVRLPGICTKALAAERKVFLAINEQILVLDSKGFLVWKYTGAVPITCMSLPSPKYLIAGTADNVLLCFDLSEGAGGEGSQGK